MRDYERVGIEFFVFHCRGGHVSYLHLPRDRPEDRVERDFRISNRAYGSAGLGEVHVRRREGAGDGSTVGVPNPSRKKPSEVLPFFHWRF